MDHLFCSVHSSKIRNYECCVLAVKNDIFYIGNSCQLIPIKWALPLCYGCCVGSRTREKKEDTSSERVVTNVCTKCSA